MQCTFLADTGCPVDDRQMRMPGEGGELAHCVELASPPVASMTLPEPEPMALLNAPRGNKKHLIMREIHVLCPPTRSPSVPRQTPCMRDLAQSCGQCQRHALPGGASHVSRT